MFSRLAGFALAMVLSAPAIAQDVIVYDDTLQNGFQDWSFGGGSDFANATPTHTGAASIAFTGDAGASNGVSFVNPAAGYAAANYTLRFFLNGGGAGGQQLALMLQTNNGGTPILDSALTVAASAPLNNWIEVDVPLGGLPFNANGSSFDRIDLLPTVASEPTLYIDDVSLIAAGGASSGNYIFGGSFEPEYMFVPQYGNSSIKIYQRATNTATFSFVREAPLAGTNPNAVSFAKDGGLWVVDDGNHKLLRYTLQSMLSDPNPVPTAQVGPVAGGPGLYDLAFFGDYAYVSSDNGVLKYPVASMTANTNPAPTTLSSGLGATPVGLAFDAQGRLWICNYGTPGNLVRMTTTGTIEVTISGNNISNAEGLAFDEYGSLWVADNVAPEMYGYASSQIATDGSPTPIGQINTPDGAGHPGFTGYAGGITFDRRGDLRANYEYDYSVRAYTVTAAPWNGPYTSYTSTELTALSNATTDPGRGGIAIWPVPHTVHR